MENSRLAGAKRRLAVAKQFTAAAAAVAFGVTFVAIRSGAAATVTHSQTKTTTQAATQAQTTTQSRQAFFGNSSVAPSSGVAPSVSSSSS